MSKKNVITISADSTADLSQELYDLKQKLINDVRK